MGEGVEGGGRYIRVAPTQSVIMSVLESAEVSRGALGGHLCKLLASIGVLTRQDRSRGPSWRKGQFQHQVLLTCLFVFPKWNKLY